MAEGKLKSGSTGNVQSDAKYKAAHASNAGAARVKGGTNPTCVNPKAGRPTKSGANGGG